MLATTAASAADLLVARNQMALSLGFHIVLAAIGVGLPVLILVLHLRGLRGDDVAMVLARRWSKVAGVLFAIGAVSGTVLSFEMGMLWPGLMGPYGDVVGLAFALEGIAFFTEAIFLGIYLYGWDRLPSRLHVAVLAPVILAGVLGSFFIVSVNGWMNAPTGFAIVDGVVTDVDPVAAMLNDAVLLEWLHMLGAAYMVAAGLAGGVYAVGWLRGRRDALHRLGMTVGIGVFSVAALLQPLLGHLAGNRVAEDQPAKLAAMEGAWETEEAAPLRLGGLYRDGEGLVGAVELPVPGLASLLAYNDPSATIVGLEDVPADERPPAEVVHVSFQVMVALGSAMAAFGGWALWRRRRDGDWPVEHVLFPWALAAAGPASVVAMEAGWITTEVGRQPWIVYGLVRTEDAVTGVGSLWIGFTVLTVVYAGMTLAAWLVLRSMSRRWRAGDEPHAPYGPPRPLGDELVGAGVAGPTAGDASGDAGPDEPGRGGA